MWPNLSASHYLQGCEGKDCEPKVGRERRIGTSHSYFLFPFSGQGSRGHLESHLPKPLGEPGLPPLAMHYEGGSAPRTGSSSIFSLQVLGSPLAPSLPLQRTLSCTWVFPLPLPAYRNLEPGLSQAWSQEPLVCQ